MTEQWIRWEPIEGLAAKYYVDSIVDSMTSFKMVLSSVDQDKQKVSVFFKDSVDVYRSTYGTFRHKLICDLDDTYGSNFYGDWTFFKITNSSYIQWLSEESYTISDSYGLIHYSFITMDFIVDIVHPSEPTVELIGEQ